MSETRAVLVFWFVAVLPGCAADPVASIPDAARDSLRPVSLDVGGATDIVADVEVPADVGACTSTEGAGAEVPSGLSAHFKDWLQANGYKVTDHDRADLSGGSFGGLASETDCARREPVVFVHGNADRALGGVLGGWTAAVKHFGEHGYRRAELYGTTYGPADPLLMWDYSHSRENVMQVRTFIEAVLAYTGAARIDVVAHSMGVTIARKAIKGGPGKDSVGTFDVGPALTARVDTFVGIAGGNRGLSSCYIAPAVPACSVIDGFYPGQLFSGEIIGQSTFIAELNETEGYEGAQRYSMWSVVDEVLTGACLVWGQNTAAIPGHTAEKIYYLQPYGHYGMRDLTAEVQRRMVADHTID